MITGQTPDISEYCDFDFYDLLWYWRAPHPAMTKHDRKLARWMGVAHRHGSDMCYWLMPLSGIPITTTVQHVTSDDYRNPDLKHRINEFNTQLSQRLDNTIFVLPGNDINDYYPNNVYNITLQRETPDGDSPTRDEQEQFKNLNGATFLLDPLRAPNNVATQATVVRQKTDPLGIPLGKYHPNPLLDTREYKVELEDGTYDLYFTNTIAENLWSQCNTKG